MDGYNAWKVCIATYRSGREEVREFIVGASDDREAVAKIDSMSKFQSARYRIVSVRSIDVEEPRYSKRELRTFARREAMETKQAKEHFFGKARIRNYKAFVRLNAATFYPDAA